MIKKIKVIPETHESDVFFFKEIDLTNLPDVRIIPLFGPNGAGKSTLIRAIGKAVQTEGALHRAEIWHKDTNTRLKQILFENASPEDRSDEEIAVCEMKKAGVILERDKNNMVMFSYCNAEDNFTRKKPQSINESFDPWFIKSHFDAKSISEGQSIIYSAFDLIDGLKPGKDMFGDGESDTLIMLDEIDSGMSIDNIDTTMRKIRYILSKRKNIQIFMSFNSPRVIRFFPYVISMYDGKVHEMHTDDDMLGEIRNNRKLFDKVRKLSNGRPRIY